MGVPQNGSGSVTEDTAVSGGYLRANGDVNISWVNDTGQWTGQTITGSYGSRLVINSNGVWNYRATNANGTIQALNTGQTLTEVFTVTSTYGTSTITITINGLDEPPCFVAGTLIDTPFGPRTIETLQAGDPVLTRDNGVQHIAWIGAQRIDTAQHENGENLHPVRIAAGAFGPGIPERDLLLSPMHRVLIESPQAQWLFGNGEVFCAAKHLINGGSIRQETRPEVTYLHMLFDDHQVVSSAGCASESFYPGTVALNGFGDETRDELFSVFPALRATPESYGPAARPVLKGFEGQLLAKVLEPAGPAQSGLILDMPTPPPPKAA